MVEFGVVEGMCFEKDGRRYVQLGTDVCEIAEKLRIGKFFVALVNELLFDMIFLHNFSPNAKHD